MDRQHRDHWARALRAALRCRVHEPACVSATLGVTVVAYLKGGALAALLAGLATMLIAVVAALLDWFVLGTARRAWGAASSLDLAAQQQEAVIRAWSACEAERQARLALADDLASVRAVAADGLPPTVVTGLPPLLRSFLTEFASVTQDDGTEIGWQHLSEATDEPGLVRIGVEFDVQGEWLASRQSEEIVYVERSPCHPNGEAFVTWPTIWHAACALAGCRGDSDDGCSDAS